MAVAEAVPDAAAGAADVVVDGVGVDGAAGACTRVVGAVGSAVVFVETADGAAGAGAVAVDGVPDDAVAAPVAGAEAASAVWRGASPGNGVKTDNATAKAADVAKPNKAPSQNAPRPDDPPAIRCLLVNTGGAPVA